jgi:hypothetical protein
VANGSECLGKALDRAPVSLKFLLPSPTGKIDGKWWFIIRKTLIAIAICVDPWDNLHTATTSSRYPCSRERQDIFSRKSDSNRKFRQSCKTPRSPRIGSWRGDRKSLWLAAPIGVTGKNPCIDVLNCILPSRFRQRRPRPNHTGLALAVHGRVRTGYQWPLERTPCRMAYLVRHCPVTFFGE